MVYSISWNKNYNRNLYSLNKSYTEMMRAYCTVTCLTWQKERLYVTSESTRAIAERRRRLPLADRQDGASRELNEWLSWGPTSLCPPYITDQRIFLPFSDLLKQNLPGLTRMTHLHSSFFRVAPLAPVHNLAITSIHVCEHPQTQMGPS